jgi:hypothetical protein
MKKFDLFISLIYAIPAIWFILYMFNTHGLPGTT